MMKKVKFEEFKFSPRKDTITGVDRTGSYLIKIQAVKNPRKAQTLKGEYEIIEKLNKKGCQSCPKVYEFGTISKEDVKVKITDKETLDTIPASDFEYIIEEFVPHNRDFGLGDIILSLLEQKSLGVFQGDIKPANIRFDAKKGICCFIDYDQAIELSEEQSNLNNLEFLNLCSEYDKQKYGFGNWLRHFPDYTVQDVASLFDNNSFNLSSTKIFNTQVTTNSATGIYHTLDEEAVFIRGSRKMNIRANALDSLKFRRNEKVLDVGCNTGLLSWYLKERGCKVTGVDNDPYIIIASQIVSNILGKGIGFSHIDLDEVSKLKKFDTIMLFSVLHHTKDVPANAKKIADSCSRIILEARLFESGKQPASKGNWFTTSEWSFQSLSQLVEYCEDIFEDFKLKTNLGIVDKNRYILEFVK